MLSEKEVKHVARLAQLSLSRKEVEKFRKELGKTLEYIKVLEEVDTKGVEPTSQVSGLEDVFRPDKKKASLSQKQTLSGTESSYKGYFKIESIFG